MYKLIISFLIFFISVSGFTKGKTPPSENTKIAVILKTLSNPFWAAMKEGILEEARKTDFAVDVYAVTSEGNTEEQVRVFENLLNKDYKAIGFAPLSPVNLIPPAAQAYKKGIYLVNIDEKIDATELKKAGANFFAFISTDNKAVGAQGAKAIVEKLGPKGGEVAILEGKAGNASGEDRKLGAKNFFDNSPNIELVSSQPADWDRVMALNTATNIIQRFPRLKAFYAANDTMALGAVKAVENSGKSIIVVGTDGVPEARSMVSQGSLFATVAQDPKEIGREAVRQLVKAIKGGKQISLSQTPSAISVPSELITK